MTASQKFLEETKIKVTERQLGYLVSVFGGDGAFNTQKYGKYPVIVGNNHILKYVVNIFSKFPAQKNYIPEIKLNKTLKYKLYCRTNIS